MYSPFLFVLTVSLRATPFDSMVTVAPSTGFPDGVGDLAAQPAGLG